MEVTIATYILTALISYISSILLIKAFSKIDDEFKDKIKLKKLDYVWLLILAIFASLALPINMQTNYYINNTIIISYLLFMSYTDQKTKLLYSSVSILVIVIEIIFFIINFKTLILGPQNIIIVLIPLVIAILAKFRFIGTGDVLIYTVLCIFYTQYSASNSLIMALNIFLTNLMFLVVNIIHKLIFKNKDKFRPLTLFITISTIICNFLLLN